MTLTKNLYPLLFDFLTYFREKFAFVFNLLIVTIIISSLRYGGEVRAVSYILFYKYNIYIIIVDGLYFICLLQNWWKSIKVVCFLLSRHFAKKKKLLELRVPQTDISTKISDLIFYILCGKVKTKSKK